MSAAFAAPLRELVRAAFVIARRDFTAIIFSKSFFFFLLGPLFPLAIGVAAGGLGNQVQADIDRPVLAVALSGEEAARLATAHADLTALLGPGALPELATLDQAPETAAARAALLRDGGRSYSAILSGGLAAPRLTGTKADVERWTGKVALLIAQTDSRAAAPAVARDIVAATDGSRKRVQLATAQGGQVVLILLVMILAGMVLSNLVEEKTNKIIEILAAAIPMEAIFLGKLFAMLGMALVGITVWTALGIGGLALLAGGLPSLPAPAVGWGVFAALMVVYFAMAYLLLGSLFLGIGAMATTVREVQTLSMPVTMGQLLVFFLAAISVTKLGEPIEWAAVIFPFSSPFAMIARAAQQPDFAQHLVAIAWQAAFTAIIIRFSVMLFRRNVMKSGGGKRRGGLWRRLTGARAG